MTASLYQGEAQPMQVVGEKSKGMLPHPPVQALKQGSFGPVMSDLQLMLHNERKQHQQHYNYAHGHNDHGMGQ